MMTVKLCTSDGSFVAEVEMPPFQKLPEVLLWGERVFQFHRAAEREGEATEYREAFAYWVPTSVRSA